jgi:hypothetical protein
VSAATAGSAGAVTARHPYFTASINFQPCGFGHGDCGRGYNATRGFGWVAPGTLTPVSMVGHAVSRAVGNGVVTLMIVRGSAPPQWTIAVPAATYDVTVRVGDPLLQGHTRAVVNDVAAVDSFHPTESEPYERVTVRVDAPSGYITLDAAPDAGQSANSRWQHIEIEQVTTPQHHWTSVDPPDGATVPSTTRTVTLHYDDGRLQNAYVIEQHVFVMDVVAEDQVSSVEDYVGTDHTAGFKNLTLQPNHHYQVWSTVFFNWHKPVQVLTSDFWTGA